MCHSCCEVTLLVAPARRCFTDSLGLTQHRAYAGEMTGNVMWD